MKRVTIVCHSAPGGKRRLAEEALRLAAGLASTQRVEVNFVLDQEGLLLLHPDFQSAPNPWDFLGQHARILIPPTATLPPNPPAHTRLSQQNYDKEIQGSDLVIHF